MHPLKLVALLLLAGLGYLAMLAAFALPLWGMGAAWHRLFGSQRRRSGPSASHLRALMKRMARQTLLMAPARAHAFSKLGGLPELPDGMGWPEGVREPRAFLAQIDLAEVRASGGPEWLPSEGQLYAFYDEWRAGFADEVLVQLNGNPPGMPVEPPSAVTPKWRFRERRVAFLPFRSVPSLDWLGADPAELNVSHAELDELADARDEPFGDELQHRIGGYPSEIQGTEMRLECEYLARGLTAGKDEPSPAVLRASRSWRLLLQIDSDPALGMSWGDAGRLYVFVREAHAKQGDFSRTVTIAQCY